MRPALVVTLSIACALALAGCGGDASPETRPLVLVTSEDPASLAATAEAFPSLHWTIYNASEAEDVTEVLEQSMKFLKSR